MCRSFCLISLATNMLEGWDSINWKCEIHSFVCSTKNFLYDIWEQIKMEYQIFPGQVHLHGVVRPLDQHVVKARPHHKICRGRGHPEGPPTVRFLPIEIDIAPLMTCIRMVRMVRMVSRMVTLPYIHQLF